MDYQKSYFGSEGLSLTFLSTPSSWIPHEEWLRQTRTCGRVHKPPACMSKAIRFKTDKTHPFLTSKVNISPGSGSYREVCFVLIENSNYWGCLPIQCAKPYGSKFPVTERIWVEVDGCKRYFNRRPREMISRALSLKPWSHPPNVNKVSHLEMCWEFLNEIFNVVGYTRWEPGAKSILYVGVCFPAQWQVIFFLIHHSPHHSLSTYPTEFYPFTFTAWPCKEDALDQKVRRLSSAPSSASDFCSFQSTSSPVSASVSYL